MNPSPSIRDRLDPFARHFAETVCRLTPGGPSRAPDSLFLAAALAAQNTFVGKHVCLDLSSGAPLPSADGEEVSALEPSADLSARLRGAACAFAVAVDPETEADAFKPLILEADRLYLQRYWLCENALARLLGGRRSEVGDQRSEVGDQRSEVGDQRSEVGDQKSQIQNLKSKIQNPKSLTRLDLDPSQTEAVRRALTNRLTVITGGPGTGKTTIVSVVLAALLGENPALDIRLCAPTGKAQARLKEALDHEIDAHLLLDDAPALKDRLCALETSTIHRLLKARPPLGRFAFNADNPLPVDVLIVDEVSMVDLSLMVHLLTAVPDTCRVILLGDSDQLAAVETGAVLAEICDAWAGKPPIARLTRSHRFDPRRGIGRLKDAINAGDAASAWNILSECRNAPPPSDTSSFRHSVIPSFRHSDILHAPSPATYDACEQALARYLARHPFRAYLDADTPAAAFPRFDAFRILCATRHGPCGVDHVNRCVQALFGVKPYGHGYPLMVTVNDYTHRLFNGDIGLCLKIDGASGSAETRVFFPDPERPGQYRSFSQAELPEHEPVFAMTVHKAQGSGFDEVLLLLPPQENPVLTRELLYTGLTRAKTHCTVWADGPVFTAAVERRTLRMSGLKGKLIQES
jgi:exodeoxyribonuclease V alpha subunit